MHAASVPGDSNHLNVPLLSVIVPVHNEASVLNVFYDRLTHVLDGLQFRIEILFVDDGSTDSTPEILEDLRQKDRRVGILEFSRNFGKEIAVTAGIDYAAGDAAVIIDADLQDPPELIPDMISGWQEGYDVVYGQRTGRSGESLLKKTTAYLFYRTIRRLSRTDIPPDTGDYRLLSRRAVDALKQLREHHRFMKGLFSWIGFRQKAVLYERQPRHSGVTKWNYWKLWNFALEGVTSFSTVPLRLATYLGFFTATAAMIYGLIVIYKTLVYGDPVAGYPSLVVIILFLGGIQLLTLGFIGEYLGRLFEEAKRRPLYFVQKHQRPDAETVRTSRLGVAR